MQQQIILNGNEQGYWFVSQNGRLWLPKGEVPTGFANDFGFAGSSAQQIGEWQGQVAWLICKEMKRDMGSIRPLLTSPSQYSDDKYSFDKYSFDKYSLDKYSSSQSLFLLAGRAVQLAEFYRSHKYCGYCGHQMHLSTIEWCCLCANCHQRYYPQISPSVIVAIRDNNKILLAKHTRHNQDNLYTILAGFVEVGETIEQAVIREVYEEAKINIKNIRYITSQPWPFPNSIMMAYLADYDKGDIDIDPSELVEANWYHYSQLPKIPEYGTVARRLIEDTIVLCREYDEYGE